MVIDTKTCRLPEGCYFPKKYPKDLVLIHFTAGSSVDGAINFWKGNKNGVSTPYIIGKDGSVFETYDPEYWSYHLGVKGTWAHDRRSVAIEMVNIGPLRKKGDYLYSWPNAFTQKYCHVDEKDKYVAESYRGFDYYAAFPEIQVQSLKALVGDIKVRFGIKGDLPPKEKRGQFDLDFAGKCTGVIDHSAFRSDKFDIGPAFNWEVLG
jgi:N-acetyl-anhydromuramyl-L-alanine amidase AmpD